MLTTFLLAVIQYLAKAVSGRKGLVGRDTVHQGWEGLVAGGWGVWSHGTCGQEGEIGFTTLSLYSVQDISLWDHTVHISNGSSLWESVYGHILRTHGEAGFLSDFKASQADNGNEPSHWSWVWKAISLQTCKTFLKLYNNINSILTGAGSWVNSSTKKIHKWAVHTRNDSKG